MEIIWTKSARDDLNDYYQNSKILIDDKLNEYIDSMINYIDTLSEMPCLGKVIGNIKDKEMRLVIYKMHKILYSIEEEKIYLLAITHTARDYAKIIDYIHKYLQMK